MSPIIFNPYIQGALDQVRGDIEIQREIMTVIQFGDYIAVLTENEKDLKGIMEKIICG